MNERLDGFVDNGVPTLNETQESLDIIEDWVDANKPVNETRDEFQAVQNGLTRFVGNRTLASLNSVR